MLILSLLGLTCMCTFKPILAETLVQTTDYTAAKQHSMLGIIICILPFLGSTWISACLWGPNEYFRAFPFQSEEVKFVSPVHPLENPSFIQLMVEILHNHHF